MARAFALAARVGGRGRASLLGLVLLLALTTGRATGQDAPASWSERVAAAGGETRTLEGLVIAMRAEPAELRAAHPEFSGAYIDAACALLEAPRGELETLRALELRIAVCREAAVDSAALQDARFVELKIVRALKKAGRWEEARTPAVAELGRSPEFPAYRGDLWWFLVRLEQDEGRLDAASDALEAGRTEIDAALRALDPVAAQDEGASDRHINRILLESAGMNLERALGRPDVAGFALAREMDSLRKLQDPAVRIDADSVRGLEDQVAIDHGMFYLAVERFDLAEASVAPLLGADAQKRDPEWKAALVAAQSRFYRTRCQHPVDAGDFPDLAVLADRGDPDVLALFAESALLRAEWKTAEDLIVRLELSINGRERNSPAQREMRARAATLRARLLLSRGADAGALALARDALDAAMCSEIAAWRALPIAPGGVGYLHWGPQRHAISVLMSLDLMLESGASGIERAFDHLLEAQSAGSLARFLEAGPVDLASVRRDLLRRGTGLIAFLPARDRTHVFLIDGDAEIAHEELAPRDEIVAAVGQWMKELTDPAKIARTSAGVAARRAHLFRLGETVCDLLLSQRARERIDRWNGAYVSGADLLMRPALECLPWSDSLLLGERIALSYLPSIPAATALQRRRAGEAPSERAGIVLFAAPESAPATVERFPSAVPFSLDEVRVARLTAPYRRAVADVALGSEATRAALGAQRLRKSAMLEFLVHGIDESGAECPPALVLAPDRAGQDGILRCRDVDELEGLPPLVTILACKSAAGPLRHGDDADTLLPSAFLRRGAVAVVASRTELALEATEVMAHAFHAGLAEGASPAESLRRVRVELASSPQFSDPFYRAGLAVTGLGLESFPSMQTSETSLPRWLWIAPLVVALVWAVRKKTSAIKADSG